MDVARFAKAQASSAWIGAALLLFFGFAYVPEPTGTDLFSQAAWVFYQTLRIGGIAMAAAAAFLMTGQVLSLAVDAFVAVTVGLLLIGTGVVMLIDGGDMVQSLINVICGAGFASSGRRSWSAYSMSASGSSSLTPHSSDPIPGKVDATPLRTSNFELPTSPGATGSLPASASRHNSQATDDDSGLLRTSNFELPTSPPATDYLSALAEKRRKDRGESRS